MIENPTKGMRVKVTKLGSTLGMIIHPRHIQVRSRGTLGTIWGWVPGHGGDVWFVEHDNVLEKADPIIGAYCTDELEELKKGTRK